MSEEQHDGDALIIAWQRASEAGRERFLAWIEEHESVTAIAALAKHAEAEYRAGRTRNLREMEL